MKNKKVLCVCGLCGEVMVVAWQLEFIAAIIVRKENWMIVMQKWTLEEAINNTHKYKWWMLHIYKCESVSYKFHACTCYTSHTLSLSLLFITRHSQLLYETWKLSWKRTKEVRSLERTNKTLSMMKWDGNNDDD